MAMIARASIEAVVEAADMVEIVSARTPLRRQGGDRWMGRCPFHEERSPSFSVNASRKLYHCFGCGVGGDLIQFVQETEGLDFAGAVEWLADRYRIQLEYEEGGPGADRDRARRDRLLALLDQAARFYERALWDSEHAAPAREYLAERDLGEEVCRAFRLGLSPGRDLLPRKARERGYTREELQSVGLVTRAGSDPFAGRLLFPLADGRGRVLGFGARKLPWADDGRAKYVNSQEGELFRKQTIVYGLDRARTAIAREGRAIVVEGYTDVLALHQAGITAAVASMGTALTERQVRELKRLASRVYLCFDADAAGQAATLRGMELAIAEGLDVRVVDLPPGKDPADAVEGFEARLDAASGYLVHRVRIELDRAATRQEAFEQVRAALAGAPESPDRLDAVRLAADRLGLPAEMQAGLAPVAPQRTGAVSARVLEATDRLERDAIAACVAHPHLVRMLAELGPDDLADPRHRAVRAHLVEGAPLDAATTAVVAELDARAAQAAIDERTGQELLLRLRERRVRAELDREKSTGDGARIGQLQATLARLREAVRELG
ncbi:MAG: DNA primase [Thermoleophilia bacterium]